MKRVLIIAATLAIAACSSAPQYTDVTKTIEVGPVAETINTGVVTVRNDKDGNWVNMVVTGSSPIRGDTEADEARAYELALMDAHRKLAEYTNNSVRASRKTTTTTNDVETVDGDTTSTRRTTTRSTVDHSASNASQLQRGLVVASTTVRDGNAYVTLVASRDTVKSAKQIKGAMQ